MRPARSRRVQAQRKFAQGAYVPPNIVAVVAADSRRDTAQDPRNVTVNNMTACGLLDVVALQSAASAPERNGHSHLTSQPVVIVERLRGKNLARDMPPPPSQSEIVETRPWVYPHERVHINVATTKKPAEPPRLQTVKKQREYKRHHPMSLRSRRRSKLELNKLIAISCAPVRKVAPKRKKNSSDEDEPLIFQQTRLKQAAEQLSTSSNQTASKDSDPQENSPKPNSSIEKSPKKKPCKKRTKKEVTTHETTTKDITSETSTKKVTSETTTKKYTRETNRKMITNEVSLRETVRRNVKQSIVRKKTPMKKRIDKKYSPEQRAYVPPDFSITVDKQDFTAETVVQKDQVTPEESDSVVVPCDPLSPEVKDHLFAPGISPVFEDDLVAPVIAAAKGDPVIPPVPVNQSVSVPKVLAYDQARLQSFAVPEGLEGVLSDLDEVFEDEGIIIGFSQDWGDTTGEDNVRVQENVTDPPITKKPAPPELAMDFEVHNSSSDILENTAVNFKLAGNVQFEIPRLPKPCVAAVCRSDKDVVNAPKELLDSRCNVCRPCIRINKLMKVSALLKPQIGFASKRCQNKAAGLQNEPMAREGEMEIEIVNINASSTNMDQKNIYLLLPYQSTSMMKVRANSVHGKEILAIGLISKDESLIDKEFVLEEHESLLDQIIETLTIARNADWDSQNNFTDGRNDVAGGRNNDFERPNNIPESRRMSISSDETSDTTTGSQEVSTRLRAEKKRLKRLAVKKKLAAMHERMREEKEREIARVEEEKRQEISRLTAEKNSAVAEMSRYHERFTQMEKEKVRDFARLKVKIKADVISKIEATRRLCNEVDGIAANLDKEKDAKRMDPEELSDHDAPGTSTSMLPTDGGLLVEAPVYHPSEEDFRDPLRYHDKIWPEAVRFGICKVVPPPGWKPPFRVHDEMRFDVTNQYISRLFNRWGPAARELCAIKLSLAQQKVNFTRPPLLDGVEVNLPKLYHLVQRHGGLETVYNKKRWGKVAEDMKFNKGPNTERKLDQIYVKYLLPYDTLSHQERQDIMRKVEIAWNRKNQKLLDRALNPLNRQKRLLGLMDSSDDETEDEDAVAAVNEAEDCIIKGAVMNRAKFRKIATMTYENTFGQGSEAADPPELAKIEEYYWRLVTLGTEHVCVHTAAIDTGQEGYGFTKNKSDPYGRHPWNPKMVSQNPRNVLQYLGPVLGVTVPTLLLGMLFSTSCWHKDPHIVSWLEFQLLGPERIWYGIPAHQADKFRKAVETLCPTSCQNKSHWLSTDITMIPPNLLREHNVTLSRVTQRDGEYILAFPNAYTCCISTGYTESESVYFAPPSWLENLWTVFKEARESCEPTMFAMEHLLYNIGNDPKAEPTILKIAQPLFDKMLREEVTNRQMLQERGLPFVQDLLSANTSRKKNTAHPSNPRDQDECEYCRATLYLSKVKGLTGRNTVVCLEHALKLLDTEKYKDTDVHQLQVLVHVSVKELNTVHDDMKRRLGIPVA